MSKTSNQTTATKQWGWDYVLNSIFGKLESYSPSQRKTYAIISIAVSLALLALASVFTLNNYIVAIIAFPAAVTLYLNILAWRHFKTKDDDKATLKERYSFNQRRRFAIVALAITLAFIAYIGTIVPYAIGGALLAIAVLSIYDFLRRVPDEIALYEAGLPDPRDLSEDELDTFLNELEEQEIEEEQENLETEEESYQELEDEDEDTRWKETS